VAPVVSALLQQHDDRSPKALRLHFPQPYGSAHTCWQAGGSNAREVGRSLMGTALAGLAERLDPAATCSGPAP
jgi:hypothetical protein